ncbi:glycosyltransferase family 4 protein [bacterium]|nr:glycosyltransferase family 4 protein [bacterium]
MRLLLLTDNYLPHVGGSRIYYHELLSALPHTEVSVLTRAQIGDEEFDMNQRYRVVRCPLEESARLRPLRLQHLGIYWQLSIHGRREVEFFRPDVILAGELVPTGPVAARLARGNRLPLFVFTHAEGPSTLAKTRWQSRLARWVCRRADRLVVASDNARNGLIDFLRADPAKIVVLLPGISEVHFEDRFQARPFAEDKSGVRLLSVGRLISRKGHETVLRALPILLKHWPDLRYTIVGEGPERPCLVALIDSLNLGGRVAMVGKLGDEEVLRLYAESDCFVLPNRDDPVTGDTEGFGIVFGEASAHGLPVIGGKTGGTGHSILEGRTGFRVDGENPQAVANGIESLLENTDLAREMGEAGRRLAMSEFRWKNRAARFEEILEEGRDRANRPDLPR